MLLNHRRPTRLLNYTNYNNDVDRTYVVPCSLSGLLVIIILEVLKPDPVVPYNLLGSEGYTHFLKRVEDYCIKNSTT